LGYIARSGATLWVAAARAGDKQAAKEDDDTPTNACPHLNLIRVGIDADKVPAAVKSRVHHHMLWINGLQSYAPELYMLRFLVCTSGVILCTFNSTLRMGDQVAEKRKHGACVRTYNNFIAVRVCGNPSRYTPLAGTGSSSARTTVLSVSSIASSLKTFFSQVVRDRWTYERNQVFVRWNRLCTSGPKSFGG
jgi:hypothetical protein